MDYRPSNIESDTEMTYDEIYGKPTKINSSVYRLDRPDYIKKINEINQEKSIYDAL